MRIAVPALLATAAVLVAVGCAGDEDSGAHLDRRSGARLLRRRASSPHSARRARVGFRRSSRIRGFRWRTPGEGITVVGTGSAETAPDVADWSFGVQAEADTAEAALGAASAAIEQVPRGPPFGSGSRATTSEPSTSPSTRARRPTASPWRVRRQQHRPRRRPRSESRRRRRRCSGRAGANQVYGPTLRVADTRRHTGRL